MNRDDHIAALRRLSAGHEYLWIETVLAGIDAYDTDEVIGTHEFFFRVVSIVDGYSDSQRREFLGSLAKIYQRDAFVLRRSMSQYAAKLRELREQDEKTSSDPLADLNIL